MRQLTTWARPTGHPGYSETLPREPASAATARRLVRASLSVWELDELADDTAVIVSELVANAVQHARRESIRITIERPGAALVRIGVVDFSRVRPKRRVPGPGDVNGRGLALVDELAQDWGTELLPWGKRVWAELRGKDEG
ncbi:ATP-binding protein [Streptomyces shenzhenensis]|uniref:ATP-binding protein n=1 Tax=Streptomyces shenzhenensis TaxID=943815 RepID=UPI0033CE1502